MADTKVYAGARKIAEKISADIEYFTGFEPDKAAEIISEAIRPVIEAAENEVCSVRCPDTCCGKLRAALDSFK